MLCGLVLRAIQAHVGQQSFCCKLPIRIENVAVAHYDSAAVAKQSRIRHNPARSNRDEIIHFHLNRCKSRPELRSADYRESDGGIDQGSDGSAVHHPRKLEMPLSYFEAQACASMFDRVEFNS